MPAQPSTIHRRMLVLHLLGGAIALACAGGGTNPNLIDISGRWRYTERYTDLAHQASCFDSGAYDIMQSQNGFVGVYGQRGYCTTPQGTADNTDSGAVTEGHVVGRTIRFKAPNCQYDGHTPVETTDRLDGNVVCSVGDRTITYTFTGTWSAQR
ncbi:MAG TPA: hypothetical protein VKB63_02120 [Gemmatimonadales bacterium]|nr:hypothetical protein [Gemmatimonadales bacterium]